MKRLFFAAIFSLFGVTGAFAGVGCSLPYNLTNGTTADATQVMANYNAIVACLGNAAAAGNNSDITSLSGLTTPLKPASGGTLVFSGANSTGAANAQLVATTTPSGFTLTKNYTVAFIAGYTNTAPGTAASALTLEVNGQTVTSTTYPTCASACPPSFFRQTPSGPQPMTGGEIQAGQLVVAEWDGTEFELLNPTAQFGGYGPSTTLASASTTDLGTIPSHNVSITGTTTITSFGQTANATYPYYNLYFNGALTITYNQTNCATTGGCIQTPGSQNIITQAGDTATVQYLGAGSSGGGNWLVTNYMRATGSPLSTAATPLCGASGLKIVNDSGTPNTLVDVTASSAVTVTSGGLVSYRTPVSIAINTTTGNSTSAANGMDGENRPTSGWLYVYLIDNGTAIAGLGSTSATAPTLPTGYPYVCRVGAMRTDGSANIERTLQLGKRIQYVVGTNPATSPTIASGTVGTYSATSPVLVAQSVAAFVPPTASVIYLALNVGYGANSGAGVEVAPNSGWGGSNNGPAGSNNNTWPCYGGATAVNSVACSLVLESTSLYWAGGGAGAAMSVVGWDDQVNAN